ncbi:MAG TPA: serine/threonine-protein kinase [Mycobacteriales bacterium]|nr:serine/threonine-protein kinase [Mycobacteriales bacterium]
MGDDTDMPETPTFGRYRADRRLGSGAFATVWLAHDDMLESPVAVKVLADNWSDRIDIRNRFLDEARILRRADSDHVVRVHDIGELADGRPYFVMTYADGGTLADRIDGSLSQEAVLEHARSVAAGLAVLHRLGVVHRDVKPSNVLFHSGGEHERVLIADLGLARAVAHASGFTLAAGTPGYMAPEQSAMTSGVDARADVYALGALITRMSTGKEPRPVWDAATAELALQDAVGIPGQLGVIARKALAPEPEQRYESAVEMAAALQGAAAIRSAPAGLGGRPLAADPPTLIPQDETVYEARPGRVVRTRSRRLRLLGALAGMILVGAGAGAYAYAQDRSGSVTVKGADDQIEVTVPSKWAGQYRDGGWNLTSFGVKQTSPGLGVAQNYGNWQDPRKQAAGVFVGYTKRLAGIPNEKLLARVRHPGCRAEASRFIRAGDYSGTAQRWAHCGSTGVMFDEVIAHPANDGDATIYLQVKGPEGTRRTSALLASVRVGS